MKKILLLGLLALIPQMSLATSEIIYGISPYYIARGQSDSAFKTIANRLPELKKLGITMIWLQPVMKSAQPGQGYDTIDYFALNPNFGSEKEFRRLISKAHKLNIRVLLDIAVNHTSIQHPAAIETTLDPGSKYHNFFQSQINLKDPYSQYAQTKVEGAATFVHYFWEDMVNVDLTQKWVQSYVLDALKYWIKEYDIDGYRFDASWGPQSRWPDFYSSVSKQLRSIKPQVFLLAEDKAAYPVIYKSSQHPHLKGTGFDAGYDWNSWDKYWVSKWSFQMGDKHEETIFSASDSIKAATWFAKSLRIPTEVSPLRYIQNNDTESFLQHHSREQTRFAASIMFLLPGTPLIFYGQELGFNYPQWHLPTLDPKVRLQDYDPELWKFYSELIQLRKKLPALTKGEITEVRRSKSTVKVKVLNGKNDELIVSVDFKDCEIELNGSHVLKMKFQCR